MFHSMIASLVAFFQRSVDKKASAAEREVRGAVNNVAAAEAALTAARRQALSTAKSQEGVIKQALAAHAAAQAEAEKARTAELEGVRKDGQDQIAALEEAIRVARETLSTRLAEVSAEQATERSAAAREDAAARAALARIEAIEKQYGTQN